MGDKVGDTVGDAVSDAVGDAVGDAVACNGALGESKNLPNSFPKRFGYATEVRERRAMVLERVRD